MSCILDFSHSHIFVLVYAVAIKVQPFKSAYNSAFIELNFIFSQIAFLHTHCTLNTRNFLVFCLHKNTKLQNEIVYLAVYNIGVLQHLLFGLVPVYVCVKILYFYQVLEQKVTKVLKLCKFFRTVECRQSQIWVGSGLTHREV